MADERKIILSAKDVEVKFRVRDKYLTAIRGVSLDLFEGETFAIVGESASGKSVSKSHIPQKAYGKQYKRGTRLASYLPVLLLAVHLYFLFQF